MDKVKVTMEIPVEMLTELQALLTDNLPSINDLERKPVPVPEVPAVVAKPEQIIKETESKPVKVTKTMIRARGLELTKTGEAGTLEDIFKKFGAEKLSDLKEEDYEEAYKLMGGLL